MRAMRITEGRSLELAGVPEPMPAAGEVLVDVIAAGVNRADLAQVRGLYPPPPGASELPGLEVSGHRRDTGQPVLALLAGGGYAEVVAVPEQQLLPIPEGMDPVDAAGVIEVAATVVSNLLIEAELREGETLLVVGGNGGIGSMAIQVAHRLGTRVLTTVGSPASVVAARHLGADLAWDRHRTDVPAAVREAGGVDVILDIVGGPALGEHVAMLNEHGRLVVIGTLGGARGELNLGALMARRARVIGTTLRSRSPEAKGEILARTRQVVWPMLADGRVRVPVQARFPLERAAEAHAVLAEGGHLGKVVLEVGRHG